MGWFFLRERFIINFRSKINYSFLCGNICKERYGFKFVSYILELVVLRFFCKELM